MPAKMPSLEEFKDICREASHFIVEDFGFREVACSTQHQRFCVRFAKDDRALEIRGEGYGTMAACHLSAGGEGPLDLIYLVPESSRPKRSRKRTQLGQLDQIRECAQLAQEHAQDFLAGEVSRFERTCSELRHIGG
jgi:hypothetical protein